MDTRAVESDPDEAAIRILLGGEATGGRVALIETRVRAGAEPPCHRHTRETELLVVLDGALQVYLDARWALLRAGEALVVPEGAEHSFHVVGDRARVLSIVTPAGFEGFYRELGPDAWSPVGAVEVERLVATAARYGCEVTRPRPGPCPCLGSGAAAVGEE